MRVKWFLAVFTFAALAAFTAWTTIDPVSTGDVASLAHPGGRVTGITAQQSTLYAKRLELLKETLPNARKIAVLSNEQTHGQLSVVQGTARRLGLDTHIADVKRPPFDLPAAFAGMTQEKCDGLLALGSGLFVPLRSQLVGLAIADCSRLFTQSEARARRARTSMLRITWKPERLISKALRMGG